MNPERIAAVLITVVGLAIAGYTEVQGVLGIVSGAVACLAYTWFLLDTTK